MGCDIHGVFQTKIGDVWVDVPHGLRLQRDYTLFGALAGVRRPPQNVQPIAEGRGLPKDFAIDNRGNHPTDPECLDVYERWDWIRFGRAQGKPCAVDMGDHSHSWAIGEEMIAWWKAAPEDAKAHIGYFFDEVQELLYQHDGVIRFVFGFDS